MERNEAGTTSVTFDPAAWRKAHIAARAELTRQGMARKAAAGGTVGPAPLGYVNRREGENTWVEIDPVKGPLVQEAFGLATTGKYSIREIAATMDKKGLRSRRGKTVGYSAMRWMLTNSFYAGYTISQGQIIVGIHEPLIGVRPYRRVAKSIRTRRKVLRPE